MNDEIQTEINRVAKDGGIVKVVLYGRISKDRANETSTETQLREMRQLCEMHGWVIVAEFIDYGKSAFKLDVDREEFEKAMALIENGAANRLIVWKLDRMSRNARGFMKINERLEKVGASFASVKEPWFDTSTPIGIALVFLMAALAQMEAEGIQARAFGYHEGRKINRRTPTGPRPFGYNRPNPNELVINVKEWKIVTEAAERVLGGDTLRGIARDFQSRGIATAKGDAWSHSTLRTFLLSPTSAALIKTDSGLVDASDVWEPLIDRETWDELQAVLGDPNRCAHITGGSDARKLKHLLPGLMTCGRCGGRMVTKSHKKGRQYGCESCDLSIMAEPTDAIVTNWVMNNVTPDQWRSMRTQGKGTDPTVIAGIQASIDELFIERATNPNRVSRDTYDRTMAILESQLEAATQEPVLTLPNIDNLAEGWKSITNEEKRNVIQAVTESIEILPYGKGQTGELRVRIR